MYANVSTSCGAICKRFIEDTVMFIWYAFICPCYLPHCFTQQLEKFDPAPKMFWNQEKKTIVMIYRCRFKLLQLKISLRSKLSLHILQRNLENAYRMH